MKETKIFSSPVRTIQFGGAVSYVYACGSSIDLNAWTSSVSLQNTLGPSGGPTSLDTVQPSEDGALGKQRQEKQP